MDIELIANEHNNTGENPYWHPDEQRLYWVDIPNGRLYRYDPAADQHELCLEHADAIGGFTVQEDGALLLFMARGTIREWKDGKLTTVLTEIQDERDSRFNDVIADPAGRVFCGTMSSPSHAGRLYRFDPDGTLTRILDGIGTSNGMGFPADLRSMYYTDTRSGQIDLFDYDRASGELSNRRRFVAVEEGGGGPDGMTVDSEDHVWGARWGGSCLVRYNPAGQEVLRVEFPVERVSSLTFGGADYTDIYVTTAGGQSPEEFGEEAGALYRLNLGIAGRAEFRSRVKVPG